MYFYIFYILIQIGTDTSRRHLLARQDPAHQQERLSQPGITPHQGTKEYYYTIISIRRPRTYYTTASLMLFCAPKQPKGLYIGIHHTTY